MGCTSSMKLNNRCGSSPSLPCPPYQFQRHFLITEQDGTTRVPTANEQEILLGYKRNHTSYCLTSSKAKHDPASLEAERLGLFGSTWCAYTTAWILGHLGVHLDLLEAPVSFGDLRKRADLEDERNVSLHNSSPLPGSDSCRVYPVHAPGPIRGWRGFTLGQRLVLQLIRGADHRGSDVRMNTGKVFTLGAWPRQGIVPPMWAWKTVVASRWRGSGHINPLESRAALSMLRWRLRKVSRMREKFVHLLDSQVSMGVLTKKRSSSHVMNVVAKFACLELAGFTHVVFTFTRSEVNPADGSSRWKVIKKLKRCRKT